MLKAREKEGLFWNRFNTEDYVYYYMYILDNSIEEKKNFYVIKNDLDLKTCKAAYAEFSALLYQWQGIFRLLYLEKEYIEWRNKKGLPPFMEIYNKAKKPGTPPVIVDDWRTWKAKAAREEKYSAEKAEFEVKTGLKFDTVDDYLRYIRGGAA